MAASPGVQTVEPQVVTRMSPQNRDATLRVGPVEFSHASTLRSPFFYITIGAGIVGLAWYFSNRSRRRRD
jgi:hypothetical protein